MKLYLAVVLATWIICYKIRVHSGPPVQLSPHKIHDRSDQKCSVGGCPFQDKSLEQVKTEGDDVFDADGNTRHSRNCSFSRTMDYRSMRSLECIPILYSSRLQSVP